jgi:hypothetical protein
MGESKTKRAVKPEEEGRTKRMMVKRRTVPQDHYN